MLQRQGEESLESYRWAQAEYNQFERFLDIGRVVIGFSFALSIDQFPLAYGQFSPPSPQQKSDRRTLRASALRQSLLALGPTFIKVGQFFSTRADLVPAEYLDEFAKLQDQVPAFSTELAHNIIEAEFGKSVSELFAEFEPIPIASASLGQVHLAKLQSGEEVVVKVQRPGLQQLFEIDLGILSRVANFLQHKTPLGGDQRDWVSIYAECQRTLMLEVDYCNEGRNADTFRRKFRRDKTVRAPKILWRYCSPRILTMEYLPGIKISNFAALEAAGLSRTQVALQGAQCYLRQVLRDGFFHADPHPGNLAVTPDGILIFYDFGMMGELPAGTTEKLMLTFEGIVQRDAGLVVQSMMDLGALADESDLGPVRRSVQYMLDTYLSQSLESHGEISMATINDDLYELSQDQPFRFPASFTFVLRSLVALEALGKMLDPEFDLMTAAEPLADELMPKGSSWQSKIGQRVAQVAQTSIVDIPQRFGNILDAVEGNDLVVRSQLDEMKQPLLDSSQQRLSLNFVILGGCFVLSGLELLQSSWSTAGEILLGMGGLNAIAWLRTSRLWLRNSSD